MPLRFPRLFNLRCDPVEESDHGWDNWKSRLDRTFLLIPSQQYVVEFLATLKEFPPSQKVGGFSMDAVLESLSKGASGK